MSTKAQCGRILSAASTTLVIAAALSGCSTPQRPSIAHAAGPATQATPTGSGPDGASAQAKFQAYLAGERAFAKCMRGIGLNVTDPDSNGGQQALFKDKVSNGGLSAAQNEGMRQCQTKLLPDPRPQTDAPESKEDFAFDQRLAACMRTHGVPGYPDPVRETDPSLPSVKHYNAVKRALPETAQTINGAMDRCTVILTGHAGIG